MIATATAAATAAATSAGEDGDNPLFAHLLCCRRRPVAPKNDGKRAAAPSTVHLAPLEEPNFDLDAIHITNKRQSPVDIRSDVVCVDPDVCRVETLTFTYLPGDCTGLVTTKGGWKVNAKSQSVLHGSHLPANGDYRLAQFHAHWGSNAHCGSEHLLDGRSMSGEVHFVFWNQAYGTFEKAVEHDDGLAVLGVFIKEGKTSKAYAPLIESIEKALATDGSAPVPANLDVDALLPHSRDFVTYLGSLTTPPYAESVIWTVLTEPVQLGAHQLAVFRRICEANFRPCQALCERKLLSSNKAAITA